MPERSEEMIKSWLEKTELSSQIYEWSEEAIRAGMALLSNAESSYQSSGIKNNSALEQIKNAKQRVKLEITNKENELDDISLTNPNSYKLQISVPPNLIYLMKAWAASEGRDLASVALQSLEYGLRELKKREGIPQAAINRYEKACEKRIALAEANNVWNKYEKEMAKEA